MKYPLSTFQLALRTIQCFWTGHKWVSSWRAKSNFDELIEIPEDELPYALKKSDNPYYEYGAWWQNKCRRCREKARQPQWDSLIVRFVRAVKYSFRDMKSAAQFLIEEPIDSVWKKIVLFIPLVLLDGINNFYMNVVDFSRSSLMWMPVIDFLDEKIYNVLYPNKESNN